MAELFTPTIGPEDAMKMGQAISWLILGSLVMAVLAMCTWWNVASLPVTGSTTFILMFATMGLWITLFLLAQTVWRVIFPASMSLEQSGRAQPAEPFATAERGVRQKHR